MVRNRHKPQKSNLNIQQPKNNVPKKTTMLIQLDEDLKKQFQAYCKENDFNCSQFLRRLIRMHINVKK